MLIQLILLHGFNVCPMSMSCTFADQTKQTKKHQQNLVLSYLNLIILLTKRYPVFARAQPQSHLGQPNILI